MGLNGVLALFDRMRARRMRVMSRLLMIARFVMLSRFGMMFRRLGVMVSGKHPVKASSRDDRFEGAPPPQRFSFRLVPDIQSASESRSQRWELCAR